MSESTPDGYVAEIFCSVQGEGPYVGEKQLFFRTAGCSETCRWCDTLYSKRRPRNCTVTLFNAKGEYEIPNPMTAGTAVRHALEVAADYPGTQVVSITGGEPLEQPDFVRAVAGAFKRAGKRVYLETNGIHFAALADVLPFTDVVAMDIKLPSATRRPLWDAHRAFLWTLGNSAFNPDSERHGDGERDLFVKVVVDDRSSREEVESAAAMIASTSRAIPLVLQPESALLLENENSDGRAERLKAILADCHRAASARLDNVRVMPQVHRLLNIR